MVDLVPDINAAIDFLRGFAPNEPWCLVAIEPDPVDGSNPRAPGAVLSDPEEARAWLQSRLAFNLYYAVNATRTTVRTTPTKDDITGLRCLHIDMDLPKGARANEVEFQRMLVRLRGCVPPPTAIVFSGGGYQAVWRFPENLPSSDLLMVEGTCRQLSEQLAGGDHCWNANRLLRLPGTINRLSRAKRARGREPAAAYLVEADWSRTWSYEIDPLPEPAEESDNDVRVVSLDGMRSPSEHDVEDLPPRLRKIIVTGDASRWGGDRSRAVYYVCCALVRLKWPDSAISAVITEPRYLLSAHVREQRSPATYAARQLADARRDVNSDWDRTTSGAIRPSQANIRRALDEMHVALSYNEFSGRAWVNGAGPPRLWGDDTEIQVQLEVDRRFGFLPDERLFRMVARDLSLASPFHPVREWLATLEPTWDGEERTPFWLIKTAGVEDTPFVRAVSQLVLVAAVRRVRQPGCKFDEMLVLVDPNQGGEKSTALQCLAVESEWFTDSVPLGAEPRKVIERTRGKWICEASDLAGMDKRHVAEIKDFLSRQSDLDRLVWDHHPTEVPRQFIIMGTTNEKAFLKDTQNRRFWPVSTGRFNIETLRAMVPQLWAEAAQLESAGTSIRLDESLWEDAAEVQAEARAYEPWTDVFAEALGDMIGKIAASDAWKIIDKPVGQRTQEDNRRMGGAMRELGWARTIQRFRGQPQGAYIKGSEEDRKTIFVLRDPITRELYVGYDPPNFSRGIDGVDPLQAEDKPNDRQDQ